MHSKQAAIDELLAGQWIQSVQWYDEVDSTNSAARRSLAAIGHGGTPALFVADRQTAGRGRSDHQWWSPDGCLMLTLAISSKLLPKDNSVWGQLALVCGVAVAEAVELLDTRIIRDTEIRCELKWPNDVYVQHQKIAGILIESAGTAAQAHWLVGIGLNVNIDWSQAPRELQRRATSLSHLQGRQLDMGVALVEVIQRLEHWVTNWTCGELHWLDGWCDRCLLTGKLIRIRIPGSEKEPTEVLGRCEGLDSSGRILVRTNAGLEPFASAEVVSWDAI